MTAGNKGDAYANRYLYDIMFFKKPGTLDFTVFPAFLVTNLLLVQR